MLVLISICLILFEVAFLFNFFSSLSKVSSFKKPLISGLSVLLAKFTCVNLAGKLNDA